MNRTTDRNTSASLMGKGLPLALGLVLAGIIISLAIRALSGPVIAAFVVMAAANIAAAIVAGRGNDFALAAAMILLMALMALPLVWVADRAAWMRENPLTMGFILILAAQLRPMYRSRWPLFAVALILGLAHVLVSLL